MVVPNDRFIRRGVRADPAGRAGSETERASGIRKNRFSKTYSMPPFVYREGFCQRTRGFD